MTDQAQDHGFSPDFVSKIAAMILAFERNAAARAAARASHPQAPQIAGPSHEEVHVE
jgi:hypothetical protein